MNMNGKIGYLGRLGSRGWKQRGSFDSNISGSNRKKMDIGIQALASIPIGADTNGVGEVEIPVNFGGVTFLPCDHIYADNTGVILSPEPLDIE